MRDRPRLPNKKAIRTHWANWYEWRHPGQNVWDEGCFACGVPYPMFRADDNKCDLERAHITARCNGGPDTADNLHLLCPPCHLASEYKEGFEYWKWLEGWTRQDAMVLRSLLVGFPVISQAMTLPESEFKRVFVGLSSQPSVMHDA